MLKIAVKHIIYEFCIDLIFERIKANFNHNLSRKFPKVGEFYSRIAHKHDDESYCNCIIERIEKRKNKYDESYYLIYAKYEHTSGKIFNDDEWAENEINRYFEEIEETEEFIEDADEFIEDLVGTGKNFKEWHDDEEVESVDVNGSICFNYNHYNLYK